MYFGLNSKLLSCQYLLTKYLSKQKFEIRIDCLYEVNEIINLKKKVTYDLVVLPWHIFMFEVLFPFISVQSFHNCSFPKTGCEN